MFLPSWILPRKDRRCRKAPRRAQQFSPFSLESLEDRCVPTSTLVTPLAELSDEVAAEVLTVEDAGGGASTTTIDAPTVSGPTGNYVGSIPVFSWTSVDDAVKYEVYLTNTTTGKSYYQYEQVTTTSFTLDGRQGLIPGNVYRFWVRAVNSEGGRSEWSDPRDFTAVSAGNVPVVSGPTGNTVGSIPTFSWSTVEDAVSYQVFLTDLTTGEESYKYRSASSTSFSLDDPDGLEPGHKYSFIVRAVYAGNETGGWSAAKTFTAVSAGNVPVVTGPSNNYVGGIPSFSWSSVDDEETTTYEVYLENVDTGETSYQYKSVDDTTFELDSRDGLTPGNDYRFYVRAVYEDGTKGGWSAPVEFEAVSAGNVPVVSGPLGNTIGNVPYFTWTSITNAEVYQVFLTDTTTEEDLYQYKETDETTFSLDDPDGLTPGHDYEFFVRVVYKDGTIGGWSAAVEFEAVSAGSVPVVTAPTGSSIATLTTFTWTAIDDVDTYQIYLYNETTGEDIYKYTEVYDETEFEIGWGHALTVDDDYSFWVRAVYDDGTLGGWSAPLEFTPTVNGNAPVVTGPSGNTADDVPYFSWTSVEDAEYYQVYLTNTTTGQSSYQYKRVEDTSFELDGTEGLSVDDAYSFWVRAINEDGQVGSWSVAVTFTAISAGNVPVASGPFDNTEGNIPYFTWTEPEDADYYQILVTNVTTEEVLYENYDVDDTTFALDAAEGLSPDDEYSFAVRAVYGDGTTGGWSVVLDFTMVSAGNVPVVTGPTDDEISTLPTFTWQGTIDAEYYQISLTNLTTNTVVYQYQNVIPDDDEEALSFTPDWAHELTVDDEYTFWVRAVNDEGEIGGWSVAFEFTPELDGNLVVLSDPEDNVVGGVPTFTWDEISDAKLYQVYLRNLTTGEDSYKYRQVVDPTFSLDDPEGLNQGDEYRFWARAVSEDGINGPWSEPVDFEAASAGNVPAITGLHDNTVGSIPYFTWDGVEDAVGYQVLLRNLTTGEDSYEYMYVAETTFALDDVSGLIPDDEYRFWVRAQDSDGEWTGWSAPYDFTAVTAGRVPVMAESTLDAYSIGPLLSWNDVDDAKYYQIYLKDLTTGESYYQYRTILGTEFLVDAEIDIQEGHEYRFWVRAKNEDGLMSKWSVAYDFEPEVSGDAPAVLGQIGTSIDGVPAFAWSSFAGAVSYQVYFSNLDTGNESYRYYELAGTSVSPASADVFEPGVQYSLSVRAVNGDGELSSWSDPYLFTIPEVSNVPKVTGPSGTSVGTTPTITWVGIEDAVAYQFSLRDITNDEDVYLYKEVTETSFAVAAEDALTEGSKYRLWVRAVDADGEVSGWSAQHDFTVTEITNPTTASLPISDAFSGSTLGTDWLVYEGGFTVSGAAVSTGDYQQALAIYADTSHSLYNATVTATVDVTYEDDSSDEEETPDNVHLYAGLVAQHETTIDGVGSMYAGVLANNDGEYVAAIWKYEAGEWMQLQAEPVEYGTGTLRFDIYYDSASDYNSLQVYLDGTLVVSTVDVDPVLQDRTAVNAIPPTGVGIISFGGTVDDFNANTVSSASEELMVVNGLTSTTSGDVTLYLATETDLDHIENPILEATVDVRGLGPSHIGLVARSGGDPDDDMYLGALVNRDGVFSLQLWRYTDGAWASLGTQEVDSGAGVLRFEVIDDTLTLSLDGNVTLEITDETIPADTSAVSSFGLRVSSNASFDELRFAEG